MVLNLSDLPFLKFHPTAPKKRKLYEKQCSLFPPPPAPQKTIKDIEKMITDSNSADFILFLYAFISFSFQG